MTHADRFAYVFARADDKTLRKALTRLHAQLSAMAEDAPLPEDPEAFLFELVAFLDRSQPEFEAAGLRCVVDRAFRDVEDAEDALERAFLLRRLNGILTGRLAFDRPAWCYHVVGLPAGEDVFSKPSARQRALGLQKAFRMPCMAACSRDAILHSRGILLEAPVSSRELLIAGAALERGCEVVLIGTDPQLPDLPSHDTAEAAFRDLIARSTGRYRDVAEIDVDAPMAEPLPPRLSPDADRAAWQLRAEILEQAYDALMRAATFSSDRHAGRAAELDALMLDPDTPETVRKAYFDIVANGSRMGHEPVTTRKINSMRHRIDALERELEQLKQQDAPEP